MTDDSVATGGDAVIDTSAAPEAAGNQAAQAEDSTDQETTYRAVKQLTRLIKSGAAVKKHIKDILERELGGQITLESFGSVGKKLGDYLGDDITYWLVALLTADQPDDLLRWTEETEGADNILEFIDFARWLKAIYGPTMSDAYNFWQEPENSWMRVNRRVEFDQLTQNWIIEVEITKYNGEVMKVAGSPTSILNFASYFVATLNQLPEPVVFTPDTSSKFFTEVEILRTKLPADNAAASADAATQSEATAVTS